MNQPNPGSEPRAEDTGFSGARAQSHEAAEKLKSKVIDQVEGVRERAESAKAETADRIRRVATQLRSVGDTLRADDSMAASLADRASRGIEGVARYVSETDVRGFVRDTEQIARRQPALFFGSAFLLGLAAGRFLKSSSGGDVSQPRLKGAPTPSWPESASGQASSGSANRTSETVPRRPGNPRFQANYDATFGRDDEVTRETRSTTSVGTTPRTSSNGPERGGSSERGKGMTP